MPTDSAFFLTKIECPVCKTVNEFETVRVGAYVERGRDTDFCPLEIQWRYPRYEAYNPLAFFTATCSNCHYSREYNNAYRDWKKDQNFKMYRLKVVKERHLEKLAQADSVVRALGEKVDLTSHPNESAVLKLHLAIFDELLAEHPTALDLGRFYLRIGWAFRDMEKGENPGVKLIRGLMSEIESRLTSLQGPSESFGREIDVYQRHIKAHFEADNIPGSTKSQMTAYQDRFHQAISGLASSWKVTLASLGSLGELSAGYQREILGSDSGSSELSFGGAASFSGYLSELRKSWDGVVTCELEALKRAVHYYQEAFASGRDIATGYQQLQASYLIAELSRRVGDHDSARQYFNSTIKHGQEFIYQNRQDRSRTALARKILELAMDQGRQNMEALKKA